MAAENKSSNRSNISHGDGTGRDIATSVEIKRVGIPDDTEQHQQGNRSQPCFEQVSESIKARDDVA